MPTWSPDFSPHPETQASSNSVAMCTKRLEGFLGGTIFSLRNNVFYSIILHMLLRISSRFWGLPKLPGLSVRCDSLSVGKDSAIGSSTLYLQFKFFAFRRCKLQTVNRQMSTDSTYSTYSTWTLAGWHQSYLGWNSRSWSPYCGMFWKTVP